MPHLHGHRGKRRERLRVQPIEHRRGLRGKRLLDGGAERACEAAELPR